MNLLKSFMLSSLLVALAALSFWLLGAATGSIVPVLFSGVLAFGRPFFVVMLLDREEESNKAVRKATLRTSAACAN